MANELHHILRNKHSSCSESQAQEVAAHFAQEFADFDKKVNWLTLTLNEAEVIFSTLVGSFRQHDHRLSEARAWLDRSDAALREKVAQLDGPRLFDETEVEKHVKEIRVSYKKQYLKAILGVFY